MAWDLGARRAAGFPARRAGVLRSDAKTRTFQYRTTILSDAADPVVSDWIDSDTAQLPLVVSRLVALGSQSS